jgi:hypothetical protein
MRVQKILSLLPEGLLDELAEQTKVNRYAKKLRGELLFKLLLHCILSHKDNSLRTMESAFESVAFRLLNAGKKKKSVRFSSISERLNKINPDYFEKIYQACIAIYGNKLQKQKPEVVIFDSTIVALSARLLHTGYRLKGGDAAHMRQLKFTIGFSGIPMSAHLYRHPSYTSEGAALKESILKYNTAYAKTIRIFDRGILSRKTHDTFTEQNIPFISRINSNSKHQVVQKNSLPKSTKTESLILHSDRWVYLFSEGCIKAKHPVRCIRATKKLTSEEILFVSNIPDLTATEITRLYKQRWDIEVFFKFLKQELNFSHLINRSENGIRVMLYATLIAAIILLVYKTTNQLSGYKIMKQRFVHDLEKSLLVTIVEMCGGNPKLADKVLSFNSS